MKKFLFIFVSILSILIGSSLTAAPASAAVFPTGGNAYYTVGDVVSLDLGCQEQGITSVTFGGGNLPDGLTMNAQGLVTGSPTTIGDYQISNYSCNWGSSGVSWAFWSLTFHIAPMTTPEPVLGVHSLNTENCSFYVGYLFTQNPDAGEASLTITNQAGTSMTELLSSKIGNQLYETSYSLITLTSTASDPSFPGSYTSSGTDFACDDTISATISYQWRAAPAASKTVSGVVVSQPSVTPSEGGNPIQKLINLNNASCQFRILGTIPSPVLSGSTHVTVNSPNHGTDEITFTISDSMAGQMIDLTFSPEDFVTGNLTRAGIVSADNKISTAWSCGTTLYVAIDYRDLLNNYHSSTWSPELQTDGFGITPTRPIAPPASDTYTIAAQQMTNSEHCTVGVTVTLPDEARPVAIGITEVNSTDIFTGVVISDPTSNNGTITAILSFVNQSDNSASVQTSQSWVNGEHPCSGVYKAVLDSPAGILASTVFSVSNERAFVTAIPLNNNNCEFKVVAALPASADPGSVNLRFTTTGASQNEVDGEFANSKMGQIVEATFDPTDLLTSIQSNPDIFYDWYDGIGSGIHCHDLINVTLEYYQSGVKTSKATTVIPTSPNQDVSASYSISAFPAEDLSCAISVKVSAPDVERPLSVAVLDPNSLQPIALIYFTGGTTTDGTFTATISMASYSDFASSIPAADKDIIQENRCSGNFEVGIFRVGQGMLASDTTYLQRTPTLCGAGYTITEDRLDCDAVPRGFYTTTYNATTGTPCPSGMTTESQGSKSPNDCYKPIVQSITGLKAPAALKFKATVNIPLRTNAGVNASASATGGCKAVPVQVVTKVKGKNVTSTMLKITAGSKAATCSISLSSPETGKYLAFTKALSIKVSKTGK